MMAPLGESPWWSEDVTAKPILPITNFKSFPTTNDPDGFGVGHVPLSRAASGSWLPAKFRSDLVTDDEFIWVTEWEKSGGGVWS
jgi:hypothetical protein